MEIQVKTKADADITNITSRVQQALKQEGINSGAVLVFVKSTTSSIFIAEDEQGIKKDLRAWMEKIAPKQKTYEHDRRGDTNGFAHLRSEILGCSEAIPVKEGKLDLGTWQNIFLVNWDNKPRTREVVIKGV